MNLNIEGSKHIAIYAYFYAKRSTINQSKLKNEIDIIVFETLKRKLSVKQTRVK